MTLGRIIAPYTQIQDFGGRNNTRGLMYVYLEPNTTTRATLYKQSNQEELTNPLIINDIGQVEDFVVDAAYKYWIYVTDLDNNKVFDRHNLATMEEGGGQGSEGYYDGDWIHIDESHRVNVNPTKQLSFETPLTVTENKNEITIGCDTSNININLEGKDGITTSKSGKKWIVSGKSLQDKDAEQDNKINGLTSRVSSTEEWQSQHGKVLTINVNSEKYTYDGSNALTVPITIPEQIQPNNGTLTIKQGDNVKGTFSANQAANTEIKIDNANDASIRLLNDEGTVIGDFTTNQANNKDISITRDSLNVYSKAQVDAKIPPTVPMSLVCAPSVSDSVNAITFTEDLKGLQKGSIYINTPTFNGTLYTVPSYGSDVVDKSLAVKYDEAKRTYYLDWVDIDTKPKITAISLGTNIYSASPVMDEQLHGAVLVDLGNIPTPIQLSAEKTYLIQPNVIGTSDYTLATDYNGTARFSMKIVLATADITVGSSSLYGKTLTIAQSQFYLRSKHDSNKAGYRFITGISSQSYLYTPPNDQLLTKVIVQNSGNVMGGDGTTRCWMDFDLGSLIITEV